MIICKKYMKDKIFVCIYINYDKILSKCIYVYDQVWLYIEQNICRIASVYVFISYMAYIHLCIFALMLICLCVYICINLSISQQEQSYHEYKFMYMFVYLMLSAYIYIAKYISVSMILRTIISIDVSPWLFALHFLFIYTA